MVNTLIRLGTKDDYPFILNSWTNQQVHIYPNNYSFQYKAKLQTSLLHLLNKSIVLVLHEESSEVEIVGYLVYGSFLDRQVIHFGYVKHDARREGQLTKLMQFSNPDKKTIVFTYPAKNENLMKVLCDRYIFDPSVLGVI